MEIIGRYLVSKDDVARATEKLTEVPVSLWNDLINNKITIGSFLNYCYEESDIPMEKKDETGQKRT